MKFNMEDGMSGLIALGLLAFLIFVIYAIMSKDHDVGEVATKKISNQSMFLLEILLILVNGAEMLTAVSIQATNTAFEISYGGRLILHGSLALISILGGFSFTKQLKEAFANPKKISQWIQAVLSLILVIGGPLINLLIMAYSMNQLGQLFGYRIITYTDGSVEKTYIGKIQSIVDGNLDPTLFATLCITLFHIILVFVICSVAYDKVYKLDSPKEEKKESKKEEKSDKKDSDSDSDSKEKSKEDKKDDSKKEESTKEKEKPSIKDSLKIVADASNGTSDVISLTMNWNTALKKTEYKDQLRGRLRNLAGNIKRIDDLMSVKSGDTKAIEDLKVQKTKYERNVQKFLSDIKSI